MTRLRALRLIFALTLALVAVSLGGVSVLRKVQSFQPLGFQVERTASASGVVSVAVVDDPATGLQQGDQIMLANGAEVGGPATLAEHLRKETQTELLVLRGGLPAQIVYDRPAIDVDVPYLILALIGVVYLLIGLYTLLRQAGGQGLLFFLWCLASATTYLLSAVPPIDYAYALVSTGDTIARILLPVLTLHLFLVFPAPAGNRVRRVVPFLYLPAAAMLALQLDWALTGGQWLFGTPTDARIRALDRVEMAHLVVYAAAAVALLIWRLVRRHGWEQRRQTQWIAFGMAGGYVPFLLLHGIPIVAGFQGPELLRAVAVVPLALVPLAFAYAILRYKLWDMEVIVRDTISMTMTLLLGIIGFSIINLAINRGISQELTLARNLLSFAAGLGIAGLLVPTRAGLSAVLERMQYRGTFGKRRALSELGRELLHERDLGRLCTALLHQIQEGVEVERTNLYLAQGSPLGPALGIVRREVGMPERIDFDALGEAFWHKDVLGLSGLALPMEELSPAQEIFIGGYRYAFPLTVRGRGVGIVVTGFRQDQTPLNSDDTELIRHLLNQAALAIENAQLLGQLHIQLEEVQSLQRYSAGIFESSPAGIAVLDAAGRIVSANAAFSKIADKTPKNLVGCDLSEVLPVAPLPETGTGPVEVSWCDPSGLERHLQVSLAVFDTDEARKNGQPLRVLVVHDVSERVAMEIAMKEQDRLAALGMLAAGVAHEVNTPITGISSYAQMLLSDTPEGHPHHEILKKVERQTFRAARIVNNLLEFARDRQKEQRPIAIAPLLTECVDLLGERLEKRRIELVWELPAPEDTDVVVLGCDGELQQVFTNLIVNAIDAMAPTAGAPGFPGSCNRPEGCQLTIRLEAAGDRARIHVQDTGPGIPPEKLDAIFQPFYSTKLNRGGTGLGLSISNEIVRRHGGRLEAVSHPGEGACFIVELPRILTP
ncbi:MAG: two-component system, NtrC family, sensor kinase [Acidobacteriota bacterium]|jgi:signal transduction histidine kinase|nr:two-component system, NtrC family, sensor kinase [Acidobacteriota bacterium]